MGLCWLFHLVFFFVVLLQPYVISVFEWVAIVPLSPTFSVVLLDVLRVDSFSSAFNDIFGTDNQLLRTAQILGSLFYS